TVDPVKLIRPTAGCEIISSARVPASPGAWVTTFSTPAGRPAVANRSAHSHPPVSGDSSDGFSTTVLPTAIGPTIARPARTREAFQVAMAPTTPTGRRTAKARVPARSDGSSTLLGW